MVLSRCEHADPQRQSLRSVSKKYVGGNYSWRSQAKCSAGACNGTSIAVVSGLREWRILGARVLGGADNSNWFNADVFREYEARKQDLQCDRVDRYDRDGFPEQPIHGWTFYLRMYQGVQSPTASRRVMNGRQPTSISGKQHPREPSGRD
jgi:hypothetical protein